MTNITIKKVSLNVRPIYLESTEEKERFAEILHRRIAEFAPFAKIKIKIARHFGHEKIKIKANLDDLKLHESIFSAIEGALEETKSEFSYKDDWKLDVILRHIDRIDDRPFERVKSLLLKAGWEFYEDGNDVVSQTSDCLPTKEQQKKMKVRFESGGRIHRRNLDRAIIGIRGEN